MNSSTSDPAPGPARPGNRLASEKSPYLRQHAHNPVDWFPWGEEAFLRARREDRPIFLSIGYSTCHWCHVMERECFEDPAVASLLNRSFVCVKVDREERPDIDQVYMEACQLIAGSGGWPLSLFLTPAGEPFFAGTYIPRENRSGLTGMLELIPRLAALWETHRSDVTEMAAQVVEALRRPRTRSGPAPAGEQLLRDGYDELRLRFDPEWGGFGVAPKFPSPHLISFLLRYGRRFREPEALAMAERTLAGMRHGGLFDQVGFGFHRYSTDRSWRVPHFEKMLYDQALLALAYLEAYQASGQPGHARTAREVLEYVRRDLRSPEGAFYSAEDADSEGLEGRFYLWSTAELREALPSAAASVVERLFGLRPEGNFPNPHGAMPAGTNILYLKAPLEERAAELNLAPSDLRERWEELRRQLLAVRGRRVRPQLDDKVLSDWNGLMIAAFSRAALVLADSDYLETAGKAATFIWERLRDRQGRLCHRYREGEAAIPAMLDDIAFLCWGLIELFESSGRWVWLERAVALAEQSRQRFRDAGGGGFFLTPEDGERLIRRGVELYDGAIPSGNSVLLECFARLAALTGQDRFADWAGELVAAFSGAVSAHPSAYTRFLCGLDFRLGPRVELVVAGRAGDPNREALLAAAGRAFCPGRSLILLDSGRAEAPSPLCPAHLREFRLPAGKSAAFLCRGFTCGPPVTDPAELSRRLEAD